ncbi:VWA domain-containing protein [Streptomyces sp. NPDC051020]|uniref:VWA domain-containing protein n=1 Tax=Streptomyces sp. NPDC051020 TaxID=3155409 RepID=UPI0034291EC4
MRQESQKKTVRRAARIAEYLDEAGVPDVWIYGADCHRLPAIERGCLEPWIADWAVLTKERIFPGSPVDENALARSVQGYGLFTSDSVANAMGTLTAEYGNSRMPVLVLFHVESMVGEDAAVAARLKKAAGKPLFWQFIAQLDELPWSVLDRLDDIREERPEIANAHYNGSWNLDISGGLDAFQQYSMIKPYARWVRESRRR